MSQPELLLPKRRIQERLEVLNEADSRGRAARERRALVILRLAGETRFLQYVATLCLMLLEWLVGRPERKEWLG